jgi:hypothetical protein
LPSKTDRNLKQNRPYTHLACKADGLGGGVMNTMPSRTPKVNSANFMPRF